MKARKRHAILDCKFNLTPERYAKIYQSDIYSDRDYPPAYVRQLVRQDEITACAGMLVLCHLGYNIPVDPARCLNRGVDVFVDYFCGDWWHGDKDGIQSLNKRRGNKYLTWFTAFARGLLLGLLSERWDDVAATCAWVEPGLRAESIAWDENDDDEQDLSSVYVSMAASLRPEPMPGLPRREKKLSTCDVLRPRLLFEAWKAARAGDQASFDQAFIQSLEEFVLCHGGKGSRPMQWVATHQSVVGLAAMRLGLRLPELSQELDARVMTRASLGID